MFFLAEYAHMITAAAFMSVLFFGGWHLPWLSWTQPEATQWYAVIAKTAVISGKIVMFIFLMMWIRWTLPRFRFDQLMRLAWQRLMPVTLALFVLATVLVYVGAERSPLWALSGNVLIVVVMLVVSGAAKAEATGRQANLPAVTTGPRPMEGVSA